MIPRCDRCNSTGLISHVPLMMLCLAGAVAWCFGAYLVIDGFLNDPAHPSLRPRELRVAILIAGVPPIALIWLAFSNVIKKGCPDCT